jgi:hypothetical protein
MTAILSQSVEGRARSCDAKCHRAKRPSCHCICGGKYHGIARDRTEPSSLEEAEKMLSHQGLNPEVETKE